jgi:hypothetical protein
MGASGGSAAAGPGPVGSGEAGGGLGVTEPQSHAPKPVPSGKHTCPPLHAPGPTHSRVCPRVQEAALAFGLWASADLGRSSENSTVAPSLVQTRCSRLV